jgi:sulfatase modifying factor 1
MPSVRRRRRGVPWVAATLSVLVALAACGDAQVLVPVGARDAAGGQSGDASDDLAAPDGLDDPGDGGNNAAADATDRHDADSGDLDDAAGDATTAGDTPLTTDLSPDLAQDLSADLARDAAADATTADDADASALADGGPRCEESDRPDPNRGRREVELDARCPAGMRLAGAVCVDAYEAFIEGNSPYFPPSSPVGPARSVAGAVPQGYVDGDRAEAACEAAGKRLCTSAEWLRACTGEAGWTYPYGATRQSGVCNDARATHPAIDWFGTSADWIWSQLGNPCINQQADSLDRAGENAECVTPEGLYDLMGNLHEWVADADGTFRGGFYADTRINGEGCRYATTAHNRLHWDYSTGFRCCASPR